MSGAYAGRVSDTARASSVAAIDGYDITVELRDGLNIATYRRTPEQARKLAMAILASCDAYERANAVEAPLFAVAAE